MASVVARKPSQQPGIVTTTTDELRDVYSRATMPIMLEPVGRGRRTHVRMRQATFGPLRLHTFATRTALRASTPHSGDVYVLSRSVLHPIALRNRGRDIPLDIGRFASLCAPGDAVELVVPAGHVGVEVVIPRAVIASAFVALTGRDVRDLRLDPSFVQTTPLGAVAMRLLSVIEHEVERDVLSAVPSVALRLADSFVHALLAAQVDAGPRPRDAGPACVRLVEAYIDAHLGEPLTLTDLGAISGVSVRALQLAFRAHRGCSPLQFLRNRRLEWARELLGSGADMTVTQVALDGGFEHLGRFSLRYRERFGESPNDTLRRARGV